MLGLVLGLVIIWLRPVEYVDTSPSSLRADFKDRYRALIAAAYLSDGDVVRARARLELLGDTDAFRSLAEQAQRTLAEGNSPQESRALGLLAVALNPAGGQTLPARSGITPSVAAGTVTLTPLASATSLPLPSETPASTATTPPTATAASAVTSSPSVSPSPGVLTSSPRPPTATFAPKPTRTATATPGAPFVLKDSQQVCDPSLQEALIQVVTLNAAGGQVPGVEVIITWVGGEEHIFTGLKPGVGAGYADFSMTPGVAYTIRPAEAGEAVNDLVAANCSGTGGSYLGGWRLVFEQP